MASSRPSVSAGPRRSHARHGGARSSYTGTPSSGSCASAAGPCRCAPAPRATPAARAASRSRRSSPTTTVSAAGIPAASTAVLDQARRGLAAVAAVVRGVRADEDRVDARHRRAAASASMRAWTASRSAVRTPPADAGLVGGDRDPRIPARPGARAPRARRAPTPSPPARDTQPPSGASRLSTPSRSRMT